MTDRSRTNGAPMAQQSRRRAGSLGPDSDVINHPPHYTAHPSGVECIQVTEHLPFCEGNAIKYLWRAGLKGDRLEDLRKAAWYVQRAIALAEKAAP
jgi:hypothetical protein